MFLLVVDKRIDLSYIEKSPHLRSCLFEPALDSVRSLEFSSVIYRVGLNIQNEIFSTKRLVVQAHYEIVVIEILGLTRVDSESAPKLREFSNKVNFMRVCQSNL